VSFLSTDTRSKWWVSRYTRRLSEPRVRSAVVTLKEEERKDG